EILVVEPNVDAMPPALADKKNATFFDAATAIDKADIVVLLVGHRAFKEINRNTLNQKVVIDTQGLFA
ncbi:MAG: NAD(P)-binding domain-containing protein, partial [Rhodospirillaceae bacterium]|nr:NAD(P)-binding domain-containing protein [Rhodospirillaceae bacterium]